MSTESAPAAASPVAAPATEAPVVQTKVEGTQESPATGEAKPQDDNFATRFAALTRKERAILEREKQIKAQEAEISALKKAREDAKINPLQFLEQHGLTYQQITEHLLSSGEKKELTADEKIEALRKQIEDKERAEIEARQKKAQEEQSAIIENAKSEIKKFVSAQGDKFELIQAQDAHDLVFDVIEEHWTATGGERGGEILPFDKAAEAVESYLEQQVKEKILKLKKFSGQTATEGATTGELKTSDANPKTLTNRQAAELSPIASGTSGTLSREESLAHAAKLLRWD